MESKINWQRSGLRLDPADQRRVRFLLVMLATDGGYVERLCAAQPSVEKAIPLLVRVFKNTYPRDVETYEFWAELRKYDPTVALEAQPHIFKAVCDVARAVGTDDEQAYLPDQHVVDSAVNHHNTRVIDAV